MTDVTRDQQHEGGIATQIHCCSTDCCPPMVEYGSYVRGTVSTSAGEIPRVGSSWGAWDWWGAALVRMGFRRMDYSVPTGLYALGAPDGDSPVFVTSNFKSSLDHLRRDLAGLISGAAITPALLPYLPGRAFSLKAAVVGAVVGGLMFWGELEMGRPIMTGLATLAVVTPIASAYAMNFTGASTCTSLSGVRSEMRKAVPLQCAVGLLGGVVLAELMEAV